MNDTRRPPGRRSGSDSFQAASRAGNALQRDAVLEFMRVLWAIDHGLESTSKRMAATVGVTGPQRLVIRLVGSSPGLAAGELASVLHVHKSTMTGVIQRLARRGILRRSIDPQDGRRVQLYLTARGRRLNIPATGTVESAVRRTLAGLPRHKIQATHDVLNELANALTKDRGLRGARFASR